MRRKSAETRQKIIDAAYTLFYQTGFMRTGVDAVAHAAGITKRTLYQHFGCKDELIGAVLGHQHQMALERIRQWADCMDGKPEQMVMTLNCVNETTYRAPYNCPGLKWFTDSDQVTKHINPRALYIFVLPLS